MPTIDFAKYKIAPVVAAPSDNQTPQINFAKYQTTPAGQQPQTPAPPPQTLTQKLGGFGKKAIQTESNVATEAAKAGTRTVLGLGNMGLGIENDLNAATGGRITGKKGIGGVFDPASPQGAAAQQAAKQGPGASGVVGTGIEGGMELAAGGGEDLLEGAGKLADKFGAKTAAKTAVKSIADIADTVAPKMSAKETAEALAKRGATKKGLLGKISLNPDPYVQKVAQSVKELVPDFNPKATYAENINATKKALATEAGNLKSQVIAKGKNIIYPFKELESKMNDIPKDISLQSDPKMSKLFDLTKKAALNISKEKGGTIADLLDARKGFDELVSKEIPNLYDKEYSPMRTAVTAMRNTMNDFIADKLPDVNLKSSLTKQSHLFSAIDNMAVKAASGAEKEVGTNVIGRTIGVIKKHPIVTGLGVYEAADTVKKLLHL